MLGRGARAFRGQRTRTAGTARRRTQTIKQKAPISSPHPDPRGWRMCRQGSDISTFWFRTVCVCVCGGVVGRREAEAPAHAGDPRCKYSRSARCLPRGEGRSWLLAVPLTLVRMELSGRLCAVGVGKEGYLSLSSGCSEKRAPGVTAVPRSPAAAAAAAGPNISNLCSAVRAPGASAPCLLSPALRQLRRR